MSSEEALKTSLSAEADINTGHEYKSFGKGQFDNEGVVKRIGGYVLRNQNWICVLMLTPISLMYDLYCICEYYRIP